MGAWDLYRARAAVKGTTRRESSLNKVQGFISRKLPDSLSFKQVIVDGSEQALAVIDTDKANVKTICCLPGDTFPAGAVIEWADNIWLVTELDAHSET